MKSNFESALLSSGNIMKRGYAFLVENAGKTIAVITAVIACLVTFTEVGFGNFGAESFTTNMIVMLIASYIIFFSLEDAGERLGRETDEYKAANEEYRRLCERIGGKDIPRLREFCALYKKEELAYRRLSLLMSHGYGSEDYEKYLCGEGCPKGAERLFKKARRMQPIPFSPSVLLSKRQRSNGSEIKNPESGKFIRLLIGLVPSTLCTLFTVSVILKTKDTMTIATVIEGLLKLTCLPIVGLRGYSQGYLHATESSTTWLKTKSRLIAAFLEGKKDMHG